MLIPLASFVILWPLLLGGAAPAVHVVRSPGLQDPSGSVPAPARPAALPIGDWRVASHEQGKHTVCEYRVDGGTFLARNAERVARTGRVVRDGDGWRLETEGQIERWSPVGERFLVEIWNPPAAIPARDEPCRLAIATRMPAAPEPAVAVPAAAPRRVWQDQSRRHFTNATRPWGGQEFRLTAAGIETPRFAESMPAHERNSLLLGSTTLTSEALLHCELQGKQTLRSFVGLVFGAKENLDCYIADVFMHGVDWEIRLYRNLQGRELQEVGKQHVRLQPADVVGWHDLDVRIRGKDVTIALGSRALLEYRADEAVAGKFGIYVSGATEALDPFVIRNFHVEGAGR